MRPARQEQPVATGAPAVERAIRILLLLGAAPEGLGAQALAEATGTPRATTYRILRVLLAHGFVQDSAEHDGVFRLGSALARLGAQAPAARDLVAIARPVMARLAQTLGETVKLVVRDRGSALTIAVADSALDARVTARLGTRIPLHIGASQRLLLAHAPSMVRADVLGQPLERRTARTLTDPAALRRSLDQLRRVDSVQSQGEGIEGIGAAAALVRGQGDVVLGALAVVYVHTGKTAAQLQRVRAAVAAAAQEISAWQLPAPESSGAAEV